MKSNLATIPAYTLYEKCKRRMEIKGYYRKVETAHDFFQGNQWGDSPPDNMPRPVVNIIDPIVSYKVGTISQNAMSLYVESEEEGVQDAFAERLAKIWEKQDMDNTMYEVLLESAVAGISAIYCYFDENGKDVVCEKKDGREILFACEEETDIEKQEFIFLPYVESVERIKQECEKLGISKESAQLVVADEDTDSDISKRCSCILKLWKEDGEVHFSKFTKHLVLIEDENTKLTRYPLAILPWGENVGNIRGTSEVSKILQNQIEINKNYARRGVSIMDGAYPRIAYLTDMVKNPESISEVGSAIGVSGVSVQDVSKAITYLAPCKISSDAEKYVSELIDMTRSLAGASDNAMGLINPEVASGKAIMAVQSAQSMPLNRQIAKTKKFVEAVGRIWLEIYAVYSEGGAETKSGKISKGKMKEAIEDLRVEVVSKNPFSVYAVEQTLEKYMQAGYIDFEQYRNMLPNGSVSKSILKDLQPKQKTDAEVFAEISAKQQLQNQKKSSIKERK